MPAAYLYLDRGVRESVAYNRRIGHRGRMTNPWLLFAAAAAAALSASTASAHDFFLLPESFHSHESGGLAVKATVGSHFPMPEIAVTSDRAEKTWAIGAGQPQVHFTGTDKTSLGLHIAESGAGKLIVAFRSKARDVDYAEDRISLILEEYRLAPSVVALVQALPKPRTWHVISRRFAKTIACVQTCNGGADLSAPVEGTLEFVADGADLSHFRLLGDGQSLARYPIDLVGSDGKRQHLETDAHGSVHIPDGLKGPMMLFAAVLAPPRDGDRFTLDLTSLTFAR